MSARLLIVAGLSLALLACDPDPAPQCAEAYEHLVELARRRPEAAERDRFIVACVAAFDEGRHACLMAATTPEEALACRPTRIRPG